MSGLTLTPVIKSAWKRGKMSSKLKYQIMCLILSNSGYPMTWMTEDAYFGD